jgi:Na+-driven multidrug efflux pump
MNAAPNVAVMVVQSAVGLIERYFVGRLGTDALAGVTLVFPVVMLMQMMSGRRHLVFRRPTCCPSSSSSC